ncbi:MAG: prephenate dehydratase [Pseudomonadota bacterium]
MSEELTRLRDRIDALDTELLRILNERAKLAQAVGHIKNGQIYRAEREARVLRRLCAENPGPLKPENIEHLFREIMSACRDLEQHLKIAYLGPQGTFSQAAAFKHFGHAVGEVPCATIDEVFRAVETGRADYAVVPVENSTEGTVSRTLDLIVCSPLKICGEVLLPIHQNLLRKGGGMDGIARVYGHAQSLAQCQHWLDRHLPGTERVSVVSNAEGARLAAEDPAAAAIAGDGAAQAYGLDVVAPRIEDEPNNTTRFLVLSDHDALPSGRDKTSLVMSAPNVPGSVVKLLQPLADAGVSMTKFESRPVKGANWEYLFFVDIEGHRDDPAVAAALKEVTARASMVKLLGSYPAAR